MIVKLRYLLFCLCLLVFYVCPAQESMMPDVSYSYLEQLIAVAKKNYPKVKMYNHKIRGAKANVEKANLSWFDIATFTYVYSPNNTPTLVNPTVTSGYQFGIYFNIGTVLVKGPNVRIAREDYYAAQNDLQEYMLTLEADVKVKYYTYVRELAILNLRTKNAVDIESSVNQVKYKFEKGEESLDNYNKGLTLYSNAIQLKIEGESAVLIAKSALEQIIGEKLEAVE